MYPRFILFFIQGIVILTLIMIFTFTANASDPCQEPVARLISLQGSGQHRHENQTAWQVTSRDTSFCPGDTLQIGANSRAAIALANETILRVAQKSTLTFSKEKEQTFSLLELFQGTLHIFSHKPRSLKVKTPYVNGVVDGTEFLVQVVPDLAIITVFEGKVTAVNRHGQVQLTGHQSARTEKNKPPYLRSVIHPRKGVEWTLYYPPIISWEGESMDKNSLAALKKAEQHLMVGQVRDAQITLKNLLSEQPENSTAHALLSIIETIGNNRQEAMRSALKSTELNPQSAAAGLALSYAHQAQFNLQEALRALEQAARFNLENSLVMARLAELYLSHGEHKMALETAAQAVTSQPETGLANSVLGFVHLHYIDVEAALSAFSRAIELDPALPLARLGLGLAKIRRGNLKEGRAEIEIAAALDPGNALIRSYLGKAYFEEKRDKLAHRQFEIAKRLDPADPTAYLYDAVRKQSINRPVEALHDLQKSISLNDNRAVYRSRLHLDDDLAARSASLGRIYTDLGFNQLAQVEAWKSVTRDPGNYSAHRFLADTYGNSPRYEIARVSSLLKSMLLQPLNVTPLQPQLAERNFKAHEGVGSSTSSLNEFSPLFLRDRVRLQTRGMAGSDGILGDELTLSGGSGRHSFSLGQLYYQNDGIRENNDRELRIYNGFVQTMFTPATSVMAEYRHREAEHGDLVMRFDPDGYFNNQREDKLSRSLRVGLRHNLAPNSTLLATAIAGTNETDSFIEGSDFSYSYNLDIETDKAMLELQHIYQGNGFNFQGGAGFLSAEEKTSLNIIELPHFEFPDDKSSSDHTNVYGYTEIELSPNLSATLGAAVDILNSPVKDRQELSPKFGFTYQPTQQTTIRAAAFRTFTRNVLYAQTIEPTLIAGFTQFLGNNENSASWVYGTGLDHSFSADLHGGLQYTHLNRDVYILRPDIDSIIDDTWREDIAATYLYWAVNTWMTLGVDYYFEKLSRWKIEGEQRIIDLETHQITPSLHFFSRSGFSATVEASFVSQDGEFGSLLDGTREDEDSFMVVDISASYRLPKQYGILTIKVNNLFDEEFHYVDIDPTNPRFLSEQQIIASITLMF